MYNFFQLATRYIRYYLSASNGKGHGTHSPFVFDFITKILNDETNYDDYGKVENLRQQLLKNNQQVEVKDFGAGSGIDKSNLRKVSSIAKHAAKPRQFGQLLYRMVRYYQPSTVLEIGTSLGITTAYLSLAKKEAKLTTMEGAPAIANIAKENFDSMRLLNTKIIEGNFDETLQSVLQEISTIDFIFLDGNHREEPTIRYFNQILLKINNDSILVVDDIHWSAGMENAWAAIKNHPSVRCTVDLFFIGIVFFREEFHERQHFIVRQ